MSDESRRPELSEAELNGVSGGAGGPDASYPYAFASDDAKEICKSCPRESGKQCGKKEELIERIRNMHPNRLHNYIECPYYHYS